jgi:uncharacterized Zn finger protein (UPF0148 family)
MTDEFLKVTCPDCKIILIVNRRDGKVVETRKPILEASTGDRFEDARLKVKRSTDSVEKKVEEAKERERGKLERLDQFFKQGLEQARKDGPVEKPKRDMDLD